MDSADSVYVITGATHGLGRGCAIELLQVRLGSVVLACRNRAAALKLADKISADYKINRSRIIVLEEPLDLSEEASVRRYASSLSSWLQSESKSITALVNNAGIGQVPFSTNSKGYDKILATNYIGHFLLTILLLPHIRDRVVFVSSGTHDPEVKTPFPDPSIGYPQTESDYIEQALYGRVPFPFGGLKAREMRYVRSKLYLHFFMYELARRLNGSYPLFVSDAVREAVRNLPYFNFCTLPSAKSISIVAMDPGLVMDTNVFTEIFGPVAAFIIWLLMPIFRMIPYLSDHMRTLKDATHHLTNSVILPQAKGTVAYYVDGVTVPSSKFSLSMEGLTKHAINLWNFTIGWVNLTDENLKAAGL